MKKYFLVWMLFFSLHNFAADKIGFVFDVDGTLKSESEWFQANEQMLIVRGIQIDDEVRSKLDTMPAGCGLAGSITFLRERFEDRGFTGSDDALQAEKKRTALAILEKTGSALYYTGAEEFLMKVKKRNIPMAVATNAPTEALPVYRAALKFPEYFGTHVYNPDHVDGKPKPNPAVYRHAVAQLGLEPAQCIAFEDSPSGARAAKEAGLYVVGYDSSNNPELVNFADRIVKTWNDIDLDELLSVMNEQE